MSGRFEAARSALLTAGAVALAGWVWFAADPLLSALHLWPVELLARLCLVFLALSIVDSVWRRLRRNEGIIPPSGHRLKEK